MRCAAPCSCSPYSMDGTTFLPPWLDLAGPDSRAVELCLVPGVVETVVPSARPPFQKPGKKLLQSAIIIPFAPRLLLAFRALFSDRSSRQTLMNPSSPSPRRAPPPHDPQRIGSSTLMLLRAPPTIAATKKHVDLRKGHPLSVDMHGAVSTLLDAVNLSPPIDASSGNTSLSRNNRFPIAHIIRNRYALSQCKSGRSRCSLCCRDCAQLSIRRIYLGTGKSCRAPAPHAR